MADDRFDIRYDPARASPERMLETVRAMGYRPEIVQKGSSAPRLPSRVEPSELPATLQALLAEAARDRKPVLFEFHAPG